MQIKKTISTLDTKNYINNVQKRFNIKNDIGNFIKNKLQDNHMLALIYDQSEQSLIGCCLLKIDDDFLGQKNLEICDLFIDDNDFENIAQTLITWINDIQKKVSATKIIYQCKTAEKNYQKFFSQQKFILTDFLFIKNLNK